MRQAGKTRGKFRAILVAVAMFAATLAGSITASTAHADTSNGRVTYISINLNGQASNYAQTQYIQLINSLRAASGHNYRDNVYEAQNYRGGLIRLNFVADSGGGPTTMSLWLNPQDLYVVAFTDQRGDTFHFNDVDVSTVRQIAAEMPQGSRVLPLAFGGSYISMTQAAGRGRETMPISYFDVWNAIFNLAYEDTHNDQQGIARSLMLMVQFTSESARFNDVCGVMSDAMHSPNSRYPGLPMLQQQLENNWAAISQFGYDISQNPSTPPRWFNGLGTLFSWSDVARYLALMLASYTLPGHSGGGSQQ